MFDFYIVNEYWFATMQLTLAMLGMGATLRIRDFTELVKSPRSVVIGLAIQLLGVPLLAAVLLQVFDMDTGVAIGIALIASIPGGTMSNVFTLLGRGHVALSIALTGITTLACLITTPIILGLLVSQHMPGDFVMPAGRIAIEISLILLLPLLLGMFYLHFLPGSAPRFSKICIRSSVFVIILIVIGATGSGRVDSEIFGSHNIQILGLFICLLALFSFVIPRLFNLGGADTTAINIEATMRNSNLGLLIKASLFPAVVGTPDPVGDNVLFTVLIYGGMGMVAGTGQVYLHRYLNRKSPRLYPDK